MFDWVTPGLLVLVISTLAVLAGVIGGHYYFTVLKPKVERSEFWKDYGNLLNFLDEYISNLVLQLAFAPGDLEKYRAEAEETGRDVRLVAAIHYVDAWSTAHGLDLNEYEIVARIEARLAQFKQNGTIPRAAPSVVHSAPTNTIWTASELDEAVSKLPPNFSPLAGCECVECTAARSVLGRPDVG